MVLWKVVGMWVLEGGGVCGSFLHVWFGGLCVVGMVVDEFECVRFVLVLVSVTMGGGRLTALCSTIMSLNSPLACARRTCFSACHSGIICLKTPA